MKISNLIACTLLVLCAASCVGDSGSEQAASGQAPNDNATTGGATMAEGPPPLNGEEASTASGLRYIVITEGDGRTPERGETVQVHYTGWLTDGTKFDSSVDRGQPFPFELGAGSVIAGWDEGVALMRVGDKRRLIIPPELGYGQRGTGRVIPPGATLVFDVELLGIAE